MREFELVLKRLFDVLGSLIGLIVLSPMFLATIFLIKLLMPGPIFFKQQRVGKNGYLFNILKFRSMKVDIVAESTNDFSKDTERLTPFGNFIRRFKIDEIPQLINVLFGEMSLVGPRPTILRQVEQYTAYQRQRLKMRPGMTGLAQINGNIALTWEERIEYDVEYIKKFSIILDIKILIGTVLVVLFGEEKYKKPKI